MVIIYLSANNGRDRFCERGGEYELNAGFGATGSFMIEY